MTSCPSHVTEKMLTEATERLKPKTLKRLKRRIRSAISAKPMIYLPLRRRRRADSVAGPDTELLLEGFPRCGNTWAEMALREAASREIKMAHHSHAAAHVIYGIQQGIPTLVLFREPNAAVCSLLAMEEGDMNAQDAYREYVRFYSMILKLPKEHLSFVSFEDVTQRIEDVAKYLRDYHELPFEPFDSKDPSYRTAVFARMDKRAAVIRSDGAAVSRSNPNHFDAMQEALKIASIQKIAALLDDKFYRKAHSVYSKVVSDIQ